MSKLLVQKERREIVDGKERIIVKAKTIYVRDESNDVQTRFGVIRKAELQKPDGTIIKVGGAEYTLLTPVFADQLARIRKVAQSMIVKDVGYIIAETGVGKTSKVVDAGLGNGFLTAALANICKQVVAYDINDAHIENAKENLKVLGLKNIKVKKGSITQKISEKNFDVVTLDIAQPWDAIDVACAAIKIGGFIVTYSPSVIQVKKTVEKVKSTSGLLFVKTIELIERKWKVDGDAVRPDNIEIGHTAFLTVIRKIA